MKLNNKIKTLIKELIPYIIILIVVILVRTFIITPVRVDGASMNKMLNNNDILLLYRLAKLERYDIVVLKETIDNDTIIKRIIGMPGETVEIKNNKIYINDEEIEDKYGAGNTYSIDKITLKDDEYYVLGDNRIISMDSRVFGPIKKEDIKGTTNFVMYPFKSIGKVE